MIFEEDDIKFEKLNDNQFEELCFDILQKLGFYSHVWRQGGADSGRDLEVRHPVHNPLVGFYEERWFVECKLYSKGVPPEQINPKISWADAEMPQHLAIMTGSYLTNNARTWLEKIEPQKAYRIHLIEGKKLKQLLLVFPELISKYFIDEHFKLLQGAYSNWIVHNLPPSSEALSVIHTAVDVKKLSVDELVFLWCAAHIQSTDVGVRGFQVTPYSSAHLSDSLMREANTDQQVLSFCNDVRRDYYSVGTKDRETDFPEREYVLAEFKATIGNNFQRAIYCFTQLSKDEGIEVLISADRTAKIRCVLSNIEQEFRDKWEFFGSQETREQ